MKIIFVGNYWPYVFGGSRIYRISPYLTNMGYEVHVVTMPLHTRPTDLGPLNIHEINYEGDIFNFYRRILKYLLRIKKPGVNIGLLDKVVEITDGKSRLLGKILPKLFNFYQEIFGYPDTEKRWANDLHQALESLLLSNDGENCVLISEYPVISHMVVGKLRRRYRFLWIADFVDLWSLNHNYPYGKIRRFFDTNLEKKTLKDADFIVTTSELWAAAMRTLHPQKKVVPIPHGFDEHLIRGKLSPNNRTREIGNKTKIRVVYAGRLYPEMQQIGIFFDALARTISTQNSCEWIIDFYSNDSYHILKEAEHYGVLGNVNFHFPVPREELIELTSRSDLLLVVGVNVDNRLSGSIPSKIYDYLLVPKPILVAGGVKGDEIEGFMQGASVGTVAVTVEECEAFLRKFQSDVLCSTDSYRPNFDFLCQYSQGVLAKRLESLFFEDRGRSEAGL